MRSQVEIDQRLDWLCKQFEKLKQRVEELERERLTVAVSPGAPQFGRETKEITGEDL
ncbi:MAG: hypothetical protein KJ871_09480 [Alphaproteobacteria bacterium]|nr:hypothetical protein [Alphaproteobacteria bacterium]